MTKPTPTILGLSTAQMAEIAKRAVRNAVESDLRAGIPVSGMVDGRMVTIDPAELHLEQSYQDARSVQRG